MPTVVADTRLTLTDGQSVTISGAGTVEVVKGFPGVDGGNLFIGEEVTLGPVQSLGGNLVLKPSSSLTYTITEESDLEPVTTGAMEQRINSVSQTSYSGGDAGSTETIVLSNGDLQRFTLDADTLFTLPAPTEVLQPLTLLLKQDSTGGRVPGFVCADGSDIHWLGALNGHAPSAAVIGQAPYAQLEISFIIGNGEIVAEVKNPNMPAIIATPALITDPREVDTSLRLWLDCLDQGTLLMQDTGVAAILDKSGYDNHAGQVTPAEQPSLGSFTGTGLLGVQLDNSVDMNILSNANFAGEDLTAFVVFERTSDVGSGHSLFFKGASSSSDLEWAINVSSSDTANFNVSVDGTSTSGGRGWNDTANTVNQPTIYELVVDATGSNVAFNRVDGGTPNSGAFAGDRFIGDGDLVLVGRPTLLGEILYFNAALSEAKRDSIVAYLKAKWGIS